MKYLLTLFCLTALALWIGCSSDSGTNNTGPSSDDFASVINSGGVPEDVVEVDSVGEETVSEYSAGGEIYYCTKRTHSITSAYEDFPQFDPNAAIIYPGALLQGSTLGEATPDPIPLKRGPGSIVMTVMSGATALDPVYRDLDSMAFGPIFQAQNELVAGLNDIPARATYSMSQISSTQELGLAMHASYENLATEVSGSFEFNYSREFNRYLVKLTQSYYTIACDLTDFNDYAAVFAPGVTPQDLDQYIGPGNPATFIHSVTYGRVFYLLVQSTSSALEIKTKIEASFDAGLANVNMGAETNFVGTLDEVSVSGYALGGDAQAALAAMTALESPNGFQDVRDFIVSGGTVTSGVPLSYVVRSLSNPSKVVDVKVATEYDEEHCIPIGEALENPIFWYRADYPGTDTGTSGSQCYIDSWDDAFGNEDMDADPTVAGHHGGEYLVAGAAGGNMPAVRFYAVPNEMDGMLQYAGNYKFTDTDYTVFAVARLDDANTTYPAYFMFGDNADQYRNLQLGYWNSSTIVMSHRAGNLLAPLGSYRSDRFQIYTFRFSREEGMAIYIGTEAEPLAMSAVMTGPLVSYPNPKFGSSNGKPLEIAELIGYNMAVDGAQRMAVIRSLVDKYQL